MARDALDGVLIEKDPFGVSRWPRIAVAGAEPHTENDRERILTWIRAKEVRFGRDSGKYEKRVHYAFRVKATSFVSVRSFQKERPPVVIETRAGRAEVSAPEYGDGTAAAVRTLSAI